MEEDETGSLGGFIGSVLPDWACGDMWMGRTQTKKDESARETLHNTRRVPRCQSLRKPASSQVNQAVGRFVGLDTPEQSHSQLEENSDFQAGPVGAESGVSPCRGGLPCVLQDGQWVSVLYPLNARSRSPPQWPQLEQARVSEVIARYPHLGTTGLGYFLGSHF